MSLKNETRVLLYSDQLFLAEGLQAAFAEEGSFQLVGACSFLSELTQSIDAHLPDILLLDATEEITIPLLEQVRRRQKGAKVVLWALRISKQFVFQAMQLGVRGVLSRVCSRETFMAALRRVGDGDFLFDKELLEEFIQSPRTIFTRREAQLLALVSRGLKNKEIASALGVTEGTIKVYLSHLYQKHGIKDRLELALLGAKNLQQGYGAKLERFDPVWNVPEKEGSSRKALIPGDLPTGGLSVHP